MASAVARIAAAVAAILASARGWTTRRARRCSKPLRQRAGLHAPDPERRASVQRLTVGEELRFLDQAYAQGGRTGLMLQTLLETWCPCFQEL